RFRRPGLRGAEVEQLQRTLGHLEYHFAAVPLRVASHLERHLAVEADGDLVAVEIENARRRRTAPPEGAQVGEDLRHADGREAELEPAGGAQRVREDAKAEPVVRDRARRRDLAGAAVDDLAGAEVPADRLAIWADLLRGTSEVHHLHLGNAPLQHVAGKRLRAQRT